MNLQQFTTDILAHLDRQDLAQNVPTFLGLAQRRLEREYAPRFLLRNAVPLQLIGKTFQLPNDLIRIYAVRIWLPDGTSVALREVPESKGRIYERAASPMSVFWREGSGTCILPVQPPQGARVELDYFASAPVPAQPQDTNPWLSNAYDVIFYATLAEAHTYLFDAQAAQAAWQEALMRLDRLRKRDIETEFFADALPRYANDGRL